MVVTRRMQAAASRIQNFVKIRNMMRLARMQGQAGQQAAAMQRMQQEHGRQQSWIKRYRPNDQVKKRHRLGDGQPKTQRVVSYTRRV